MSWECHSMCCMPVVTTASRDKNGKYYYSVTRRVMCGGISLISLHKVANKSPCVERPNRRRFLELLAIFTLTLTNGR